MEEVRKWSEKDIKIKLHNLRKRIPLSVIQQEVKLYKYATSNLADAMNLAYYSLKRRYSKINIYNFGVPKQVTYTPKTYGNWSTFNSAYYVPYTINATSSSCTITTSYF